LTDGAPEEERKRRRGIKNQTKGKKEGASSGRERARARNLLVDPGSAMGRATWRERGAYRLKIKGVKEKKGNKRFEMTIFKGNAS